MVEQTRNSEIVRNLWMFLIIVFFGFVATILIGFGGGGFDTDAVLDLFTRYGVFGLGAFLAIGISLGILLLSKKTDKYGETVFFDSPGELIPLPKIFKDRFFLFLLFGVIFSIVAFMVVSQGQAFTGEVLAEQQFSATGELSFKTLLIPISENLVALAVMVFFWVILIFVAAKQNWPKSTLIIFALLLLPLIYMGTGIVNHEIRYGDTDVSLAKVSGFWYIQGLLTVGTGSFIPALMMHLDNNLFFMLQDLFSSDAARIFAITIITAFVILLIIRFVMSVRKK